LPFPVLSDVADVPRDIEALAEATETAVLLYQALAAKGQPNGYAGLDASGKVPAGQLPPPVGGIPTPIVNGQWIKGVGGVAVWAAITWADLTGPPKMQAGYGSYGTGSVAVGFPIAFASRPSVVITSESGSGAAQALTVSAITTTGFTLTNGTGSAHPVSWIAAV
jgi:hypothetical protein